MRSPFRLLAFFAFFVSLACAQQPAKPLPKAPAGVLFERDVVYGKVGEVELKLNLARPESVAGEDANAKPLLPCVVIIHGGAWRAGDRTQHDNMTWDFAKRGYVAATIGYRFCPQYPFPAQIEDVKCAVRFLRAHAEKYGLDPDRIGAIGFSAGAHLSMMLGTMDKADGLEGNGGSAEQSSKVQAVVSYFGPTDFTTEYPNDSRNLVKDFLGGTMAEKPDAYKAASPLTYVNAGDAPMLLFQGTKDNLVPHSQAYKMIDALTSAGVVGRAEFIIGGGHGNWSGTDWTRTNTETAAFFDQQLKHKKATPKKENQ